MSLGYKAQTLAFQRVFYAKNPCLEYILGVADPHYSPRSGCCSGTLPRVGWATELIDLLPP